MGQNEFNSIFGVAPEPNMLDYSIQAHQQEGGVELMELYDLKRLHSMRTEHCARLDQYKDSFDFLT